MIISPSNFVPEPAATSPMISSTTEVPLLTSGPEESCVSDIENRYFFTKTDEKISFKGRFVFDDVIEECVDLIVVKVAVLTGGSVYEIKINQTENVPDHRLSLVSNQ
jgi:hypothetical protein